VAVDTSHFDDDAILRLCQKLARHMRGALTFETETGFGASSLFSAPFAIEHSPASTTPEHSGVEKSRQPVAAGPSECLGVSPIEPFDQSYLDALSNEGIDLDTFERGWRQSMNDDLERLCSLRARRDVGGLRGSLHRLSGAVGLVGASGLMETLRYASVTEPEPAAAVLDTLVRRIELLMIQLDEAIDPHRSNWR
jgi:hypothetical protein